MNFDGKWQIEIPTPMGKQAVVLDIVHNDGALSGQATSGDEIVQFIDPFVVDGKLLWSQNVTKPLRLTIKFELSRTGDDVYGTAKAGIFPANKVTGFRVPQNEKANQNED